MRRGNSKILITGSIAGFTPGSFQAIYNGTKAFLNSFSFALREELRDTKVTVTCLTPGATETEFFKRAEMMDTAVGTAKGRGRCRYGSQEQGTIGRRQRNAGQRAGEPASDEAEPGAAKK